MMNNKEEENINMNNFYGKNVLITGGTGLIGRPIVSRLLQQGAIVKVASLSKRCDLKKVEHIECDLCDINNCKKVCKDIDYVFHLAGKKTNVGTEKSESAETFVLNSIINLNMLEASRQAGVDRYLFMSTIYPDLSKEEKSTDAYGSWCKKIGEIQCEAYTEQFGMKISVLRVSNVYGPYDDFNPGTSMFIGSLISKICSNVNPIVLWGDGSALRDFIYVDDVASAALTSMEHSFKTYPSLYDPMNIGSGKTTSIADVVKTVLELTGKNTEVIWDKSMPVGNNRIVDEYSMYRAKKKLGYISTVSLKEGLKRTIEWYMNKNNIIDMES